MMLKNGLFFAAALFAASAHAQVINVSYTATVTDSSYRSVHVGDLVAGSFSFDTVSGQYSVSDGESRFAWGLPHAFSATVNGRTASSNTGLSIDVATAPGDAAADSVHVHASDINIHGQQHAAAQMGIVLNRNPDVEQQQGGIGLGSELDLANFYASNGQAYGYLMENGRYLAQVQLNSFSSDFVTTPVPEPTTLALTALGLGPLLLAARRRKFKA